MLRNRLMCVWVLALVMCVGFLLPNAQAASKAGSRPNIVLIMVDDMGWSDIGCYGGEVITPNLNKLAAQGMRFTQFYNNAKCTTTRASIVTGLWPRRQGSLLKTNMVTLGEVLGAAGYQTSLSGKWHLGHTDTTHPYHRGFQQFYGLLDGCCNFFNPVQPDPKYKGGRVRVFGQNDERINSFPDGYYTTDAFTTHAIQSIEKAVKGAPDKPFFAHITYTAPHYPLHAKPKDIAKYKGKFMMGWDVMREQRYSRQKAIGLIDPDIYPLSKGDSRAYAWETADQEFEDHRMAVYAAMIDSVDQNIGRLRSALEKLDVADNTLICFLSDNGGCAEEPGGRDPNERNAGPGDDYVAVGPSWGWAQNAPFRRYKQWVHEGGANTPMIAWWPGVIKRNTIEQQPGHIVDFMATFIELAGTKYPKTFNGEQILPLEGQSLLPIFEGKKRMGHAYYAWEWSGNRAYRVGDWKIAWDKEFKEWELYDLSLDRTETENLATIQPGKLKAMAGAWDQWAIMTGAPGASKPPSKKKK